MMRAHAARSSRWLFHACLWAAWAVNVALLTAVAAWLVADGRAPREPLAVWDGPSIVGVVPGGLGVVLGGATLLLVLLGTIFGPPALRGLRGWLLATGLCCGWCGLLAGWTEFHWRAQQSRVAGELERASRAFDSLRDDWPTQDGELAGLGPYLAYPKGRPHTLLFLGDCTLPATSLRVSAVEKTADGSLRLELSGAEPGVWLERRAEGTVPQSFIGGLETSYGLMRYAKLAPEWFIVRYDARPLLAR